MITLEINPQTLTDTILTLDSEGVMEFTEWLQLCWERNDDVMLTIWGICEGDISPLSLSGEPYTVVEILRLFCDTPERNFLEGKPALYIAAGNDQQPCFELDLIATEKTMRAWVEGLDTLQQTDDCVIWEFASAYSSRRLGWNQPTDEHPLPPSRITVRRIKTAEG